MDTDAVDTLAETLATGQIRLAVVGQGYVRAVGRGGRRRRGAGGRRRRQRPRPGGRTLGRRQRGARGRRRRFELAVESGRSRFGSGFGGGRSRRRRHLRADARRSTTGPDLSCVEGAGAEVAGTLRAGQLVVLESTTYPGTTEQVLQPDSSSRAGCGPAATSCWRTRPSASTPATRSTGCANIPRVVGGLDCPGPRAPRAAFYGSWSTRSHTCRAPGRPRWRSCSRTRSAWSTSPSSTSSRSCAPTQGIDLWEVIERGGHQALRVHAVLPRPGVGGHCIPLDPTYLAWQSRRDTGRPFRLVEMAQDINAQMPDLRACVASSRRSTTAGMAVTGRQVLALGVTYKPNVGDVRESAAVPRWHSCARKGADVSSTTRSSHDWTARVCRCVGPH